jgi:tetratricopeptide (TPR) repeat protein
MRYKENLLTPRIMKKNIILILTMVCCQLVYAQLPVLTIQEENQSRVLKISKMHVSVEVTGNIAVTTYDVLFFNSLGRDLEGELSLALGNNQEICRYALDINGNLREGVIIEKVKARQTFEAIVRQNIDPGIGHLTLGNHFKTRIYPIPANGYKRVLIAVSETLTPDGGHLNYILPFAENIVIDDFKLQVQVNKTGTDTPVPMPGRNHIAFTSTHDAYIMNLERTDFHTDKPIEFSIPVFGNADHQVFTCDLDGKTYFYLFAKAPLLRPLQKTRPSRIAIYWDNSFRAQKRDMEKETDLLRYYLGSFAQVEVRFIAFNLYQESTRTFTITGGDAGELINHIRNLNNDGATCLKNIRFNEPCNEILFFSDGISTIGEAGDPLARVPVHTITSASGSNYGFLKNLAAASAGEFVDLTKIDPIRAAGLLNSGEEKFLRCRYNAAEIIDLYPQTPARIHQHIEINGVLLKDNAVVHVDYGSGSQVTQTRSYTISKSRNNIMVPRIWGSSRISSLSHEAEKNKVEIQQLGRQFGILTPNTSFIVLDRVEDYVQYDVPPPAELLEEFNRIRENINPPSPILPPENDTPSRFSQLAQWYDKPAKPKRTRAGAPDADEAVFMINAEVAAEEMSIDPNFPPPPPVRERGGRHMPPPPPPPPAIRERSGNEDIMLEIVDDDVEVMDEMIVNGFHENRASSIKVLSWMPDAPWMDVLRSTGKQDLESVYFTLRVDQFNRPSFYLQVADYFYSQNLKTAATRILSNMASLDLENPELLKITARRLLDEKEYELAIALFRQISLLRPEEPQSFRDLAMAYRLNGQYNDALILYNHILDKNWQRFNDLKDVALNELNNLVALHRNQLNPELINRHYITPMPLDIRITIDWSTNDNDIDLWVVDPNGEKCMYSNKNTQLGGKISYDFTNGYGPEEFSLKKARRGTYVVYVNFFNDSRQSIAGPVTVYATLSTRYGTVQEQTRHITIQLDQKERTLEIGKIEFE